MTDEIIPFTTDASKSVLLNDADAIGNARGLSLDARIFHFCQNNVIYGN